MHDLDVHEEVGQKSGYMWIARQGRCQFVQLIAVFVGQWRKINSRNGQLETLALTDTWHHQGWKSIHWQTPQKMQHFSNNIEATFYNILYSKLLKIMRWFFAVKQAKYMEQFFVCLPTVFSVSRLQTMLPQTSWPTTLMLRSFEIKKDE